MGTFRPMLGHEESSTLIKGLYKAHTSHERSNYVFFQICVNVILIFVIILCQYIEKNGTKYVKLENTRRINFSQIEVWTLSKVMQVPWPTLWQLYCRPRLTGTQREK